MNEVQLSRLADAPVLYRPVVRRAYAGNSKAAGIKAFCLQCVGYFNRGTRRADMGILIPVLLLLCAFWIMSAEGGD